jgi:quinol monooxygenase YgiN
MADMVYVSITGLELKRAWHAPVFWRHAIASMSQAQQADGCLSAEARTINGVHHTLSIWESRDKMLTYLRTGAHLKAMQTFEKIATGKVFGFETDTPPNWSDVHDLWVTQGKTVSA